MENNQYFCDISLDHAALAQLPENGELPGMSAVTLPNDESGTEPDFELSDGHDSELCQQLLAKQLSEKLYSR